MSPTADWICDKLEMKDIWDALQKCPPEHVPAFPSSHKIKRDKGLLVRKLLETGPYWDNMHLSLANESQNAYKARQRATRAQLTKNQRTTRQETASAIPVEGFFDLPTKE
ncbi:hypothetical protein FRC11_002214 [Ceratobasidium sp. 423]|nr:hypothetical protein FRC11_002214 [Ceratobasidium sp. 423]